MQWIYNRVGTAESKCSGYTIGWELQRVNASELKIALHPNGKATNKTILQ